VRKEKTAMSSQQADVQVTLSLPVLRKGQHSGEQPVYRLQFMLNFIAGVDNLDVDGVFGPKTEAAVRDFQQGENLPVDRIVGRQTWTTLLRHWMLFSRPS
jgi:peptidoglycan hydrolase-like protein with peptidoglycan-binding domain